MKLKTTLIFLVFTLVTMPAFAGSNKHKWQYSSGYDNQYLHNSYRSNHGYSHPQNKGRYYGYKPNRYHHNYGRSHDNHSNYRSSRSSLPPYYKLMSFSPDRFARWYADTAIAQVEEARYSGCRFHKGKGRWTSNWNDHYRHGRKSRRDTSIFEVETRARELRQCGHYGYRG